jgi:hypothetical protein
MLHCLLRLNSVTKKFFFPCSGFVILISDCSKTLKRVIKRFDLPNANR